MLKRIFSLVLIALVLTLVGCKASGTEDNNDEKLDSENSASEKEPVLVKELGTIGTEDDVFVEEEVDLSEYPKTVDLEDLSYTVDYFEQELMSNYSVYIREHPGNPKEGDFPTVDYVRPGDKVYAFEKAVVDGVTYYHVRKGNLVGWSIADDLVDYDGAKVSARRNNYGSPFANTTYAPNSVYISKVGIKDTTIHSFTLYGVQTENFDKAIKKEDS
ncbi:hypothetical protein [Ornithinibacillus sp. JPR2-1]|uniref:hypothetical protein n=1 Tax=Ornithinibacillus sp. JPR2-1 TaxID=2094019 RepID=UPI0031E0EEC8